MTAQGSLFIDGKPWSATGSTLIIAGVDESFAVVSLEQFAPLLPILKGATP